MKIGQWDNVGRARGLVQRQIGELGATEFAAHVTVNAENGRLRVFVATDAGLLDYQYAPAGASPEGTWILRGQLIRWGSVRGLRLQTESQQDDVGEPVEAHQHRSAHSVVAAPQGEHQADGRGELLEPILEAGVVGPVLAFAEEHVAPDGERPGVPDGANRIA
mgnify:CR=1 FL=1